MSDILHSSNSIEKVIDHIQLMDQLLKKVLKEGEHFGTIPGCGNKPTLLKPGAEKLLLLAGLTASIQTTAKDLSDGHREYTVICTVLHKDVVRGTGVGSACTMESKWRWRWDNTGKAVPKEYWTTRDSELLGGPNFIPRKVKGEWLIYTKAEANPYDYYNTALKIAKKRALVDAALTATGTSDLFSQDIEDMVDTDAPAAETENNDYQKPPPQKKYPMKEAGARPTSPELTEFHDEMVAYFGDEAKAADWLREQTKWKEKSGGRAISKVNEITTKKWLNKLWEQFEETRK
jgi:hypothetical protein